MSVTTVMAAITKNCLYNLKEVLQDLEFGGEYEPLNVLVVSINRYAVDVTYLSQTNSENHVSWADAYDLVITDCRHKVKCTLSPDYNSLVQLGELCPGSLVRLTECSLGCNEQNLSCGEFIYIKKLEILQTSHRTSMPPERLLWAEAMEERDQMEVPLLGTRGCYLSVWSDDDTHASFWKKKAKPTYRPGGLNIANDIITIKDLSKTWQQLGHRYPLLCVRVLQKNRVRHYSRTVKGDKWPFQAQLFVADRSGVCTAILWNRACVELYNSIDEGGVLLITNYIVKPQFKPVTVTSHMRTSLTSYDLEIGINSHHPPTKLVLVHPNNVLRAWRLPETQYNFVSRRRLSSLPAESICDVCGVVVFVGRWERQKKPDVEPSGNCWVRRWIKLVDDSSEDPVVMEIYRCGLPEVHDSISPRHVMVCTNMKAVHSPYTISSQQSNVYLTTTWLSQVYTAGYHIDKPYAAHPYYQRIVDWSQTNEGRQRYSQLSIGGYFAYPPLPTKLRDFTAAFDEENQLEVTPCETLCSAVQNLYLNQSRRFTIQAYLLEVEYVPSTDDIVEMSADFFSGKSILISSRHRSRSPQRRSRSQQAHVETDLPSRNTRSRVKSARADVIRAGETGHKTKQRLPPKQSSMKDESDSESSDGNITRYMLSSPISNQLQLGTSGQSPNASLEQSNSKSSISSTRYLLRSSLKHRDESFRTTTTHASLLKRPAQDEKMAEFRVTTRQRAKLLKVPPDKVSHPSKAVNSNRRASQVHRHGDRTKPPDGSIWTRSHQKHSREDRMQLMFAGAPDTHQQTTSDMTSDMTSGVTSGVTSDVTSDDEEEEESFAILAVQVVNESFANLRHQRKTIGTMVANVKIFPRVLSDGNAAFLKQEFALPCQCLPKQRIAGNISGIPSPGGEGYFKVTLLSLDRSIELQTVLLIPREMRARNFIELLSGVGDFSSLHHGGDDTSNVGTSGHHGDPSSGFSASAQRGERLTRYRLRDLLTSAQEVGRRRVVCVLDAYCYWPKDHELVLNRGFVTGY